MKERSAQPNPENELVFAPESLQSFNHILEYEQKNITKMVRKYAFWSISKNLTFGIRSFFQNDKNERTKYIYYLQQARQFEESLTRSIMLRTSQIPPGEKADYVRWATATAIYKMHMDDEIEKSFPDEAFRDSRKSLSRKLILNSRKLIYLKDNQILSNDWTNQIAMRLYSPPLMENERVFKIADVLNEYVYNPVYDPDEIVLAGAGE